MLSEPIVAIDLNEKRVYAHGRMTDVYDWIVERWDSGDMLYYDYPMQQGHLPIRPANGWTWVWMDEETCPECGMPRRGGIAECPSDPLCDWDLSNQLDEGL